MTKKYNNILISVGCNIDHDAQMARAKECLSKTFPGIRLSTYIISPAYGMPEDASPYANMLAEGFTELDEPALTGLLKDMECQLGDSKTERESGRIWMDLDLLLYNKVYRHEKDWERPYIKELLQMLASLLLICTLHISPLTANAQSNYSLRTESTSAPNKKEDAFLLARALEYYQGCKYHEASLAFEKLKASYKLNPRFMAFLGFCYFKEGKYEEAIDNLTEGIPELSAYSPHEQSVYIFSCAESHFQLRQYEDAIHYYTMAIPLVDGYEKGDILYHKAFSYYMLGKYSQAHSTFNDALALLKTELPDDTHDESAELHKARIQQTENMIRGLSRIIKAY